MFKSENAKFQLCENPTMASKQAIIPAKIELRRRLGRLFQAQPSLIIFFKQKTHIDFPLKIPVGLISNTITRIIKETANL